MNMNIKINDKEIELRNSFKAYIAYEEVAGESFTPKGLKEIITLFYCMAMTSDLSLAITFDDFIGWLDNNPGELAKFSAFLAETAKRNEGLAPKGEVEEKNGEDDKKK